MGIPVLILGESGTGKSASLRNFKADDLMVINVANKPLPFKNKFESVNTDTYRDIIKQMKLCKKPVIVIDDAQYLMANEFMRRATERGYDKFTEIAQNFWTLVNAVKDLKDDVVVYFLAHIERDVNGNEKIKTIGKLLDEKITVEGMYTIVLKTNVTDGVYSFLTQNSGHDTVKSPIGMFPTYAIDNDLKYVDEKIRNYYEIGEFLSDEELKEIDETVKHGDIPIKEEKPKGRRKKSEQKKEEEPTDSSEEEAEEGTEGAEGEEAAPAEEPKKRRRKSAKAELETEREEVRKRNGKAIAEANTSDETDEIPYEEAEEPKLEELPKRKRRGAKTEEPKTEEAMTPPEESEEESEEESKPTRRRRRRA